MNPVKAFEVSNIPRPRESIVRQGRLEYLDAGKQVVSEVADGDCLLLVEEGQLELHETDGSIRQVGRGSVIKQLFSDSRKSAPGRAVTLSPALLRWVRSDDIAPFLNRPSETRSTPRVSTPPLADPRRTPRTAALHPTDPEGFVDALQQTALQHRAVRHPYLRALECGDLPDDRWALADFVRQYAGYSSQFPRYLAAVISRLEHAAHRKCLLENLNEESGHYREHDLDTLEALGLERAWFNGIPHPELFERIADKLGSQVGDSEESDQVLCWHEMFQHLLVGFSPAQALGALGIGTEYIVSTIYRPFLTATQRLPELSPRDIVFFPLHTAVDDDHHDVLRSISVDFAKKPNGRTGLRIGMLKALNLRASFWDWLYARALDPTAATDVV